MYRSITLPNKLRVITHDIKEREGVALGIWIDVGGRYESASNKGAAHFLEHILFKGSQKYSCSQIKESIEGVGGTLNAFTSEEQTCYYAKVPTKHFAMTFDILADMVLYPLITGKDVQKEKGVILEEIKMYNDLPQYLVSELLDELMWPDHPLGQKLAGTLKSVAGLTPKDVTAFHHQYYSPANVVVAACGNFRPETMTDLIERKWKEGFFIAKEIPLAAVNRQDASKVKFLRKDTEQMHLALGMFGCDHHHPDRFVLYLLNIILGGNMSSRLFNELREKRSLSYSIGSGIKLLRDTGVLTIRAGIDNTKIVKAATLILRELHKIKQKEVTKDELMRAKDYYLGQVLLGLEDTLDHMLWIGESTICRNKIMTLDTLVKEVKKVTLEDIKRVARDIFKERHFNLSIVGPLKDPQERELSRLLAV